MKTERPHILIIEDDALSRLSLKSKLEKFGHVLECSSKKDALEMLKLHYFDMAFIDLDLECQLAGLELLNAIGSLNVYSVVLSGREDESVIERAYHLGCRDYLTKPFTNSSIELIFKKYQQRNSKVSTLKKLKDIFLTNDEELVKELETIEQALLGARPILITGESGTGKTFLAKFIHQLSSGPFVHLNCAEISESLLESELFGHEKGAFTGAVKAKKGLLELANEGILFLDEIATMPLMLQKKLLNAIEEKSFYPLGSEKQVHSNFRLISATCENLKQKIENGEFRADFYFRIEGFNVRLKPLRERTADINAIMQTFIKQGERRIVFDSAAKALINEYGWPGNVRELQRTIEILQTKERGIVTIEDLRPLLVNKKLERETFELDEVKKLGLKAYVEKLEGKILKATLEQNVDKVRKTLSDLKISNNSYYRILENMKKLESGHV